MSGCVWGGGCEYPFVYVWVGVGVSMGSRSFTWCTPNIARDGKFSNCEL